MLENPVIRNISRSRLEAVFKDPDLVKLFENILYGVGTTLPGNMQEALDVAHAAQDDIDQHEAATTGAHAASAISVVPAGGIAAVNVQAALIELDAEKQPLDGTLTALAALVTAADQMIYATGVDAFALTAITGAARTFLAAVDAAAQRTALALGTIATQDAGAVNITGGTIALTSGSLGYAAGNGGTVTQATSKATGVTLDKVSGEITLNAAALAAGAAVTFALTNSTIAAADRIILNHKAAGTFMAYALDAQPAAGSALIGVRNVTAGSLSEAIVIGFTVIKSANA